MRFYLFHPKFWVFTWWHEFTQASSRSSALLYLIQWGQSLVKFNYSLQRAFVISRFNQGEECHPLYRGLLRFFISGFYGTTAVENAITERAIAVRVHPGCCTGARILLPCEISQQYHANELFTHRTSLQYFRKSKVRSRRFSVPVDNFLRTLAENIQYTYYYSFV